MIETETETETVKFFGDQDRDRDRKISRPKLRDRDEQLLRSRPEYFFKKFNLLTTIIFIFSKIQSYISNKLASPACYKKVLLYVVTWKKVLFTSQYPSKCAIPLYTVVRCFKVRIFTSKKHLKPCNKRNRDNLFNAINYILANQVIIMKKIL